MCCVSFVAAEVRNCDYRHKGETEKAPEGVWGEEGIDKIRSEKIDEKIEVKRLHPSEVACDDRTSERETFTRTMGTKIPPRRTPLRNASW